MTKGLGSFFQSLIRRTPQSCARLDALIDSANLRKKEWRAGWDSRSQLSVIEIGCSLDGGPGNIRES
jgi:hypothetical protein